MSPAVPLACKVYTPSALASAIVRALGDAPTAQWLEPSVGRGAFVEALALRGVSRSRIRAIDIDRMQQPADRSACTLRGRDFFAWARRTDERFDRIVGNPPFVAFDALTPFLRRSASRAPVPSFARITAGGNYWHAFLCVSLALLKPGGSIGFVLPAAWEYADYGRELRSGVRRHFSSLEVHRCQQPLFDSAKDGSVVVIARGYAAAAAPKHVMHGVHRTRESLIHALNQQRPTNTDVRLISCAARGVEGRRVGDLLRIGIGAVTGDATYFLLTEERRNELQLPRTSVRPVLTKAKQLTASIMNKATWEKLLEGGQRIWLFRPSELNKEHPAVKKYLRLSRQNGGCDRSAFKVRMRAPWYRAHIPCRCDAFLSGMSQSGPWLCLNQMKGLIATNTLYIVSFREQMSLRERCALALTLQTSSVSDQLVDRRRVYPQGLIKFEPRDLLDVRVDVPERVVGARATYAQVTRRLIDRDIAGARELADRWYALAMASHAHRDRVKSCRHP
jgi:adenine-specific DNA-methyltransferase